MKPSLGPLRFAVCVLLLSSSLGWILPVAAQSPIRIIFLHHSCGHNLIEEGGVREGLTALGYEFYDHGYNDDGLRLADGSYTGTHFDVPGDNTDPDGIAAIFSQPLHDPPDTTFSHLMQYDVIIFKSCFPTSNIGSDEQLDEFKGYYLTVRDRIDQYPDKLFIVVTQPPQVPGASDAAEGRRARALADWLASEEFLGGRSNVFTFDFFDLLAGDDNFLRSGYRYDDEDGHPNARANGEIGPQFVAFVDEAIRQAGVEPSSRPVIPATPDALPVGDLPPSAPVGGMIDDFESGLDAWYADFGEGAAVACDVEGEVVRSGAASLRVQYTIPDGGWGGCGHAFDTPQDWSSARGLSLWLRSDGAVRPVTLVIFAGDPNDPTPFEMQLEVGGAWEQVVSLWTDFDKAEWVGDAGLPAFDPAQVVSYAFNIEAGNTGVLWVDDVEFTTETESLPPAVPTQEPGEGGSAGGGLCGSVLLLPLGALGVYWAGRRRVPNLTPPAPSPKIREGE